MHLVFTIIVIIPYTISLILPITKRHLIKNEENTMNSSNNIFNISYSFKLPSISICIGSPSQCVDVIIDTFANIGWISGLEVPSPHPFNEEKSTTYTKTSSDYFSYDYKDFYILGKPSIDILKINEKIISPLPDFSFLLTLSPKKYPILSVDGIMGLSRNLKYKTVDSKALSLMEYLYQKKIIDKRVFTFVNYKHSDKGKLFIGELPGHFNITSSIKCECLLPRNPNDLGWLDVYWNCNLIMINLLKNQDRAISFLLNYPILFQTGNNYIVLTDGQRHVLQLLANSDALKGNNCVLEDNNKELFIECDLFNTKLIGDIAFRMDSLNELVLKSEDFFITSEKNNSRMESVIRVQRDASYMVIGNAILKNYDISFDMDNSMIYFQESREETTIKNGKIFYFFYFIVSILLFAIILLSISIWKGKKNLVK